LTIFSSGNVSLRKLSETSPDSLAVASIVASVWPVVDETWIGVGRIDAKAVDIRTALRLYRAACGVQLAVLAILVALSWLS